MQESVMEILETTIITANDSMLNALSDIGGVLSDGEEKGLDAFEVSFSIVHDSIEYNIVFQTEERNDSLKYYNGYEMTTASKYGCDADESEKFLHDCEYDESYLDKLECIANGYAEKELKNLRLEYKDLYQVETVE